MADPRFLLNAPLRGAGEYDLDPQESHHAASVLRLRTGDAVMVFDGQGACAPAVLAVAGRNAVHARVESADDVQREEPAVPRLTIATAIPKGKRWQGLVEKCTELGADAIIPLHTERSVAKGEGDKEKWKRWAVEASKQCRRNWIPEMYDPCGIEEAVVLAERGGAVLILADADGDSPFRLRDQTAGAEAGGVVAVIGPEGGLTDGEIQFCKTRGAKTIRLSPFILRVETAAAAMCAFVREYMNG